MSSREMKFSKEIQEKKTANPTIKESKLAIHRARNDRYQAASEYNRLLNRQRQNILENVQYGLGGYNPEYRNKYAPPPNLHIGDTNPSLQTNEVRSQKRRAIKEIFTNKESPKDTIASSSKVLDSSGDQLDRYEFSKMKENTLKAAKGIFSSVARENLHSEYERITAEKIGFSIHIYMKGSQRLGGREIKHIKAPKKFLTNGETDVPSNPKDAIKYAMQLLREASQKQGFDCCFKAYYDQFMSEMKD